MIHEKSTTNGCCDVIGVSLLSSPSNEHLESSENTDVLTPGMCCEHFPFQLAPRGFFCLYFFVFLPHSLTCNQTSHPAWPFVLCLWLPIFHHTLFMCHPAALLASNFAAQTQMDYSKPINLTESEAQWSQVTVSSASQVHEYCQDACASAKQRGDSMLTRWSGSEILHNAAQQSH